MNELSWLLYSADVAGEINGLCGFVTATGVIGLVIYAVGRGVVLFVHAGISEPPPMPSVLAVGKRLWLPVLIASLVGVLVPGKDTLYAIAASEMGERVLQTETASKATKALNAWLDRQIAEPAQ